MPVIERIGAFHDEMVGWRRDIHAHPETAFEETRTADLVARTLSSVGIEVHRGLAETGVVGILRNGDGPAIGLRADMDALHMDESAERPHASRHPGKMHACGHDGHTSMLLGAAKYLAETKRFKGEVVFIFQPAEENEGGARRMIEDGLFQRFPVDTIYGMHNWPGLAAGSFAVWPGPVMAAFDLFDLNVIGVGAHSAMPHKAVDPIIIGAQIVTAWQSLISRRTDPQDAAVLSVTRFHAGSTWNVTPDQARLSGTVRSFDPGLQAGLATKMANMAERIAEAMGGSVRFSYDKRYPPTLNAAAPTEVAVRAATDVAGVEGVSQIPEPSMSSEDFSFMLNEVPGCYIRLGNGLEGEEGGAMLHNPTYDFNDAILPVGASYWARLVEQTLSPFTNRP